MAKKNEVGEVKKNEMDLMEGLEGLGDFKAAKGEEIEGLERLDETDIQMPKIKLAQSTTEEVGDGVVAPGQFFNTVTKKTYDEVKCSLLVLGKSRVKFSEKFKRGEAPECMSIDGIKSVEGKKCETCVDQSWDQAKKDGKSKPDCVMSYVWLGVTVDEEPTPFRMVCGGKSVSTTKAFLNKIAPKKFPPFVYDVVISSKKESNDQGTYFVIQYDIVGVASKDEAYKRKELAEGFGDMFNNAIKKDAEDSAVDMEESTEKEDSENAGLF